VAALVCAVLLAGGGLVNWIGLRPEEDRAQAAREAEGAAAPPG
jgi:hypothetical protein